MNRTLRLTLGTAAVAGAILLAGGGIALAANADSTDTDETDTAITGPALDRASTAALAHTGEGRVTETEVGDEDSYYEVEVTLDNGTEVDVQLDKSFVVVDASPDSTTDD